MNVSDLYFGKAVLILYLAICAYQDYKNKQIDLRVCFSFYMLFTLVYVYLGIQGKKPDFPGIVFGLIPALCIFFLSKVTRSSIGMGDGYFVLGLGYGVGIAAVSEILFYSMMSMAAVSLVLAVYCLFVNKTVKGKSIPMIPYVLLPGILVILQ